MPRSYWKKALRGVALTTLLTFGGNALLPLPAQAFFFGGVTLKDEKEMGRKFDVMVRSHMPVIEDPEVSQYVDGIVKRLVKAIPPQPSHHILQFPLERRCYQLLVVRPPGMIERGAGIAKIAPQMPDAGFVYCGLLMGKAKALLLGGSRAQLELGLVNCVLLLFSHVFPPS